MRERWFEGIDSYPCRIKKDYDDDKEFIQLYLKDKSILLDENNKPFEQFLEDCDLYSSYIEKSFITSNMISKGLENGFSMEDIRNTYCQIVKILDDDDCFNLEKAFNLSDEELRKYVNECPELNLSKRYQFVFKEDEMEQIYLGLIDGISIDDIKKTYCKYQIIEKNQDEPGFSFKYKEPISLYSSKEMSQARISLKDGLSIEQVNFFLKGEKDFNGYFYPFFNEKQMKAISICFKKGLTCDNLNDILAFKESYVNGSMKKVCICSEEEIYELAEYF